MGDADASLVGVDWGWRWGRVLFALGTGGRGGGVLLRMKPRIDNLRAAVEQNLLDLRVPAASTFLARTSETEAGPRVLDASGAPRASLHAPARATLGVGVRFLGLSSPRGRLDHLAPTPFSALFGGGGARTGAPGAGSVVGNRSSGVWGLPVRGRRTPNLKPTSTTPPGYSGAGRRTDRSVRRAQGRSEADPSKLFSQGPCFPGRVGAQS